MSCCLDFAAHIVEAIWPTSSVYTHTETGSGGILPLRIFIQETLRRSRSSYSTLQVALYYLILVRPEIPANLDFTMEQRLPEGSTRYDDYTIRVLQCGRRMFLAALILASKYLQDRNFSARAWSKISGLSVSELNQNERSFLHAVNFELHITEEVFNRWTDVVMKLTPPGPPSLPGRCHSPEYGLQCERFKKLILKLWPGLEDIHKILPRRRRSSPPVTPRSEDFLIVPRESLERASNSADEGSDTPSTPRSHRVSSAVLPVPRPTVVPSVLEPKPPAARVPVPAVPAFGLLPTPRLTPQSNGFNTPAVSAVSQLLGKRSSMEFAMAQASTSTAAQVLEKWPASTFTPPQACFTARRSSLANSISTSTSTASSPESMISDSSQTSRSSSISSASGLVSAPSSKLDVQARCRLAKLCSERLSLRPTIATVPEDYEENCLTASPEMYTGPVGKDICDLSLGSPMTLQKLLNPQGGQDGVAPIQLQLPASTAGTKRNRPSSDDNLLQDNVRELLKREPTWSDALVRARASLKTSVPESLQVPVRSTLGGGRKRLCCSAEVPLMHPSMNGPAGPGMWRGILN